ncbi:MAG: PAS domain-containing protein [bacterium]
MAEDPGAAEQHGTSPPVPADWEFRTLLEKCPDIVALLDEELRCTFVNPAVERSLGRPPSDYIGKTPAEVGLLRLHEFALRAVREGGEHCDDIPVAGPDGELEFEVHLVSERAPGGRLVALFLVARDVTIRRRLERALQESERRFRMVLENSPVTVATCDRHLRYTWIFNPYPAFRGAAVIGKRAEELAPEQEIRELIELEKWVLENGAGRRAEIPLGSGENLRWYDTIVEPVCDENGSTTGLRIAATDITDRRRAEEAVRESQAHCQLISEAAPHMVWSKSPDGTPDYVNRKWIEFTGLTAEQTARVGLLALVHPEDRQMVTTALNTALERGQPYQVEHRMRRSDGKYVWVLSWGVPLKSARGEAVKWIGTVQDIEARKQAEERLARAERMESIAVLAAGIAHDFNNLLTGVLGNASLVLESLPPADQNRRFLRAIIAQGEKAAELTRKMLAFAGKGRFVLRPVDLSATAGAAIDALRDSIPASIIIGEDLAPELPPVEGDAEQIEQVARNLIENAAEALGNEGGEILVRTSACQVDADHLRQSKLEIQAGEYVCLEVHDTGPGMDRGTLGRIFEPFFSTRFAGRGLGLPAVHGIVRAHGGATSVTSAPGMGTRFAVLLPALTRETCRGYETGKEASGDETVLLVDEEEDAREVAREALSRRGFRPIAAAGGREALDAFRTHAAGVAAVVLGVGAPHRAAEDNLQRLRAIRNVPVLIATAYSEPAVRRKFGAHEIAGLVPKPYSGAVLAARVRDAIDRRAA